MEGETVSVRIFPDETIPLLAEGRGDNGWTAFAVWMLDRTYARSPIHL